MQKFIKPSDKVKREYRIPGDKSITHRAVMFNAVAFGRAKIFGGLMGEDCISTINCVRALGASVSIKKDVVEIEGATKITDGTTLDAGNSGTTLRLLSGLLSGLNTTAVLTGDDSLRRRPMKRVTEPLRLMRADITSADGFAPLSIKPAALRGIDYLNALKSAQVKSAILLAGLNASGKTTVTEPVASRNHTEIMLKYMGADIKCEGLTTAIKQSRLSARDIFVAGDISGAAFFMADAAIKKGGEAIFYNVGINDTRSGILKVLKDFGAIVKLENIRAFGGEPVADIIVKHNQLKGVTVGGDIIPSLIDEIPIIATIAAFAEGKTVIRDAGELRVKESDRIAIMTQNLNKIGAAVTATADGFIIEGRQTLKGGVDVDSALDHRIAMSMAIAAKNCTEGLTIQNAECAAISFPNFYEVL
jgi:3-phosphoshikimate 1-carboxyvinyltransferase